MIEALIAQVANLQVEVNDLKARLSQNSCNSSPLPSSGEKRGAQPGHRRSSRPLVPAERLIGSVACKPTARRDRGNQLDGPDPRPLRHQAAEILEIRPDVDEHQIHALAGPVAEVLEQVKAGKAPCVDGASLDDARCE